MNDSNEIPTTITQPLMRFVQRRRRLALAGSVARAISFALVWLLLWAIVDRLLRLSASTRWIVLIVGILGLVACLARALVALFRTRIDWTAAAEQVERRDRALNGRLATVTGQLQSEAGLRGSPAMLAGLIDQVTQHVGSHEPSALLSSRGVWRAAGVCVAIVASTLALCANSWFDLPTLLKRLTLPNAAIAPVTTTRLHVRPGDIDVIYRQPQTISVTVERLGSGPVELLTSSDGKTLASQPMTLGADGAFTRTIPAVDRDYSYRVKGGDAVSPTFQIRVLRPPAVAEFNIQYDYPTYLARESVSVINTDGLIEAPIGTRALIRIQSTEPLSGATMRFEAEQIISEPTDDPTIRQFHVPIDRSGVYQIEMRSTRNVPGSGPADMTISALPDQPPVVRMLLPRDDVRAQPRSVVAVPYQAADDYGLSVLKLYVQVNSSAPRELPIGITGDPKIQQDTLALDLADFPVQVGDVVSVWLVGGDAAAQQSVSQASVVLIAPRTVDVNAAQRLADLKDSIALLNQLIAIVESGIRALDEARDKGMLGEDYTSPDLEDLSLANGRAGALVRTLLRAIIHSDSPGMSVALSRLADSAQVLAIRCDRIDASGPDFGPPPDSRRQRLVELVEMARRLLEPLQVCWQGEQATMLLADRENLRATLAVLPRTDRGQAVVLRQALERTGKLIESDAAELGFDPKDEQLDFRLAQKAGEKARAIEQLSGVDVVDLATRWAQTPAGDESMFQYRLTLASQAEAVRSDSDLVRARDLGLSSGAARALESRWTSRQSDDQRSELAPAIAALARQHALYRTPRDRMPDPATQALIVGQAVVARELIRKWAGEPGAQLAQADRDDQSRRESEQTALEAGARSAARDHDGADRADADRARQIDQSEQRGDHAMAARSRQQQLEVERESAKARRINELGSRQGKLRARTEQLERDAQPREQARELARQQRELAREIDDLDTDQSSPEQKERSRQKALAAIRAVQERLAVIPGQLAAAGRAAEAYRDSRQAARHADPRAAPAASRQIDEARRRLSDAADPVDPTVAQTLAEALQPYSPETSPATDLLLRALHPPLAAMKDAMPGDDPAAVERGARQARQAIEEIQSSLSDAQRALMEHDPIVAAQWFAEQAANALQQQPPDLRAAARDQLSASSALDRAWDRSIHEAAAARLAGLPSMASLFAQRSDDTGTLAADAGKSSDPFKLGRMFREWGWLRQRDSDDLLPGARDFTPPGYQEALKVYFDTLAKSRRPASGEEK